MERDVEQGMARLKACRFAHRAIERKTLQLKRISTDVHSFEPVGHSAEAGFIVHTSSPELSPPTHPPSVTRAALTPGRRSASAPARDPGLLYAGLSQISDRPAPRPPAGPRRPGPPRVLHTGLQVLRGPGRRRLEQSHRTPLPLRPIRGAHVVRRRGGHRGFVHVL
jgi:hypothetical protein